MKTEKRQNSLKNLQPFEKGKSGNPKGRKPLEQSAGDLVRKIGAELEKNGKTKAQNFVDALFVLAKKGNAAAINQLGDRLFGKVVQPIKGEGEDGEITIRFIKDTKVFES